MKDNWKKLPYIFGALLFVFPAVAFIFGYTPIKDDILLLLIAIAPFYGGCLFLLGLGITILDRLYEK